MATDMKYFTSNDGYQLAYQEHGDPASPPLILLHGFTGSSQVWKKNIPTLATEYHVLAPDLRGHGASAKSPYGYHVSRLAMDLNNLLSHTNLTASSSVRCVAGSLGCAILWCYAELFTADVFSHMVWVDQSPMQNYSLGGMPWGAEQGNRGMNNEAAVRQLFADLESDPDSVYRGTIAACLSYRSHPDPVLDAHVTKQTWDEDEAFFLQEAQKGDPLWYAQLMKDHTSLDWRDTISECFGRRGQNQTKVLVVASTRSGCFPAEGPLAAVGFATRRARLGEALADMEGVVVEWGGHWCYWEDPAKFHELLMPFLDRE